MAKNAKRFVPPTHRLATATLIDAIVSYAADAQPKTVIQRQIFARLEEVDPNRKTAMKLAANFRNVPNKHVIRAFGDFQAGSLSAMSIAERGGLTNEPALTMPMMQDDVGGVVVPDYPPGTEFTLIYTGLYCRDESGDRGLFRVSDEPYVITSVVAVDNGNNEIRTELHPIGVPSKHYDNVDDGESRVGPEAAVWQGQLPNQSISLVTVVMEKDDGDPDAYKEEIALITAAAASIAAAFGLLIPAAVIALVGAVLNWLGGSGDDVLGTTVTVIPLQNFRIMAPENTFILVKRRIVRKPVAFGMFQEETVTDNTGIPQHFAVQVKDGADYFACFKYTADRPPTVGPGLQQPGLQIGNFVVIG